MSTSSYRNSHKPPLLQKYSKIMLWVYMIAISLWRDMSKVIQQLQWDMNIHKACSLCSKPGCCCWALDSIHWELMPNQENTTCLIVSYTSHLSILLIQTYFLLNRSKCLGVEGYHCMFSCGLKCTLRPLPVALHLRQGLGYCSLRFHQKQIQDKINWLR